MVGGCRSRVYPAGIQRASPEDQITRTSLGRHVVRWCGRMAAYSGGSEPGCSLEKPGSILRAGMARRVKIPYWHAYLK